MLSPWRPYKANFNLFLKERVFCRMCLPFCGLKGVSREREDILEDRAYTEAGEFTEKKEKPLDYNRKEIDRWGFGWIADKPHQLCFQKVWSSNSNSFSKPGLAVNLNLEVPSLPVQPAELRERTPDWSSPAAEPLACSTI